MKRLLALLLVLVLTFSIISCDFLKGGNGDETPDEGDNGENEGGNKDETDDTGEKEDTDNVVDTPIIDWPAN